MPTIHAVLTDDEYESMKAILQTTAHTLVQHSVMLKSTESMMSVMSADALGVDVEAFTAAVREYHQVVTDFRSLAGKLLLTQEQAVEEVTKFQDELDKILGGE